MDPWGLAQVGAQLGWYLRIAKRIAVVVLLLVAGLITYCVIA